MAEIRFLEFDEIIYIHSQEILEANTLAEVRNKEDIFACIEAPKASFDGALLMDIFEMSVSYMISFCIRHPFTDGNKRVALASAIVFLNINGYEIEEEYECEFADLILKFLSHEMVKEDLVNIIRLRCINLNE
jgi:death on curing protein